MFSKLEGPLNQIPAAALTVIALAGCATPATWTKVGATPQAFDADKARCAVYAYKAVPEYRPPQNSPTMYMSYCAGDRYSWNCNTTAIDSSSLSSADGVMRGAEMARVDRAREAAFSSCMYDQGWQLRTQDPSRSAPVNYVSPSPTTPPVANPDCPADCGVVYEIKTYNRDGVTLHQVVLDMEDGKRRYFSFTQPPSYRVGDRIKIVDKKLFHRY
jgi:hypothetical protein